MPDMPIHFYERQTFTTEDQPERQFLSVRVPAPVAEGGYFTQEHVGQLLRDGLPMIEPDGTRIRAEVHRAEVGDDGSLTYMVEMPRRPDLWPLNAQYTVPTLLPEGADGIEVPE